MTAAALMLGAVMFVLARIFGPSVRRSVVTRRLRSGSSALADRTSVTLSGTIREVGELIEAPLSGRRCVFFHASAELPEPDPTGRTAENLRLTTCKMIPFELDTPAGVVLIDGTGADLELKPSAASPRSADRERAFIVAHGRGVAVAAAATFRELALTPGMQISVHGVAMIEDVDRGERGYRDAAPTRVRIVAHASYALAIGKPQR